MAVPEAIQKLVEKYTFHRDAYLRGQEKYNETQPARGLYRSVLPRPRLGCEQQQGILGSVPGSPARRADPDPGQDAVF